MVNNTYYYFSILHLYYCSLDHLITNLMILFYFRQFEIIYILFIKASFGLIECNEMEQSGIELSEIRWSGMK
jgi:hypothetical protein